MSLKWLSKADRAKFAAAQSKEMDQWVDNAVFSIARRAGVPIDRIMSMRWILTWKDAPENSIAKARLVIKGFQDPDLCTVRAEATTLSKLGRHLLLQMAASNGFTLEMGDVKTAFLQGDRGACERDVYAQLVPELAKHLGLTAAQIIRLEGAVYGLRNDPRRWWHRVKRDMLALGWRCHQLEQCIFLKFDGNGELI